MFEVSDRDVDRRLRIFFGEATPESAVIQIDWIGDPSLCLSGHVKGPLSDFANTLPTTVRFDSPGNIATLRIPDPCFWSPLLPTYYQVRIQASLDGEPLWQIDRMLGIRRLGTRGKHLFMDGKRIVLRGVCREEDSPAEIGAWREHAAAMWGDVVSDAICQEASRLGVILLCRLRGGRSTIETRLAELSRWPSVAFALLQPDEPLDESIQHAAPNILLVTDRPEQMPSWASVVAVADEQLADLNTQTVDSFPVIAIRRHSGHDIGEARSACDILQRDLSPDFDLAGYLV